MVGSYTPLYASPQQMRGASPDPRDDVYALGVIWWQLLTGDLSAGRPGGRRWHQRLKAQGMDETLIEILTDCLEEEPGDRPADANVLASTLAEAFKQSPIPAMAEFVDAKQEPTKYKTEWKPDRHEDDNVAAVPLLPKRETDRREGNNSSATLPESDPLTSDQNVPEMKMSAPLLLEPTVQRQTRCDTEETLAERRVERVPQNVEPVVPRPTGSHTRNVEQTTTADVYHKGKANKLPRSTTPKSVWPQVVVGLISIIVVGYFIDMGINLSQANQRNIVATEQAKNASATAQAIKVQPTTIALSAESTMLQAASELQPLIERFGIRLVEVPAGIFTMGSPDSVGANDEHPQFEMAVDTFWISLTEVSNAQYQHFINANGYTNQDWWTNAGWDWRMENKITQPQYWDDEKWNEPSQPVVGVSWYEATAYTTWLTTEMGLAIRLPTEAEWEKAARGVDARIYPWGNESPNDQLLNYNRNVGQTVDVGSYPAGASPYLALDMAGNVWEWTATQWVANYDNYVEIVSSGKDGNAMRALRGGAWGSHSSRVSSANRTKDVPNNRNYNFGFRLVVFIPGN